MDKPLPDMSLERALRYLRTTQPDFGIGEGVEIKVHRPFNRSVSVIGAIQPNGACQCKVVTDQELHDWNGD